jgi:Asp/Glu/Hydantoin racemase
LIGYFRRDHHLYTPYILPFYKGTVKGVYKKIIILEYLEGVVDRNQRAKSRNGNAGYAASTGADAILSTCSAFGPCIEAVAREHAPMPVLKPNEAMIEQAAARGRRIGLLATFAPTLVSMPDEFPRSVEIVPKLAAGALAALDRGARAEHDRLVAEASRELRGCDLIALAQYSMAPAAALVAEASGRPVLTTPDSAVLKLKELLAGVG